MKRAARRALAAAAALAFTARAADAYRPFASSDAAVAEPRSLELETGYFGLTRDAGRNTVGSPQAVVSWGLRDRLEAVAEFVVLHPRGRSSEVADAALNLKGVLREGVLQGKPGPSVAAESGVLVPFKDAGEKHAGFEQILVASGRAGPFMLHWNAGGGFEREASLPFASWGLIVESPSRRDLRLVGELNGSDVRGFTPDNSGLLGAIWETGWRGLAVDAGYRRGLSAISADWSATAGFTVAFLGR